MMDDRNDEQINRLIDILDSKQMNYQNKIKEASQRQRIKSILIKYPGEPIYGLIDLESAELAQLLIEFLGKKYTQNDLDIKKYWISEGRNNEVLKRSMRYKEAKKLFDSLIDKLQQYLDYVRDFHIIEQDNSDNLKIVDSLNVKLKKGIPILDLSVYYPILSPNETLNNNDIYDFLVAICVNNLKLIDNEFQTKDITVTFARDVKNSINSLIEELIITKEEEKRQKVTINPKLIKLKNLIEKLKNNYDEIINVYPNEIRDIMEYFWKDEKIKCELEKLIVPVAVIQGQKKGLNIKISGEELNILKKFINLLVYEENDRSKKTESYNKYQQEVISNEVSTLKLLLTKLKMSSKALLEKKDFDIIIQLLKDSNKNYDYIINSINMLNSLNLRKYCRDLNNASIVLPERTLYNEGPKQTVDVQSKDHDDFLSLLKKHGFNCENFPLKLIDQLFSHNKYNEIENLVEYIDRTEELHFLKDYTNYLGETAIEKKVHEIKCSQICFILAYSNQEILNNFINISKSDGLSLIDIFSIPKVFASKNNEELSGTYENFIINENYIKQDYPTILKEIMSRCPFVLGTDSYLFRKNVELTESYGMNITKDSKGALPTPMALATPNLEYIMDRYIEVQDYDYIECFRNQLETNASVALRVKYLQLKNIDIKQGNFVNIDKYFNNNIEKYLYDLTIENIAVALNDPLVKWLDSINEEMNDKKRNIQYVLNGIYISRLKLLKYFSTLIINNYENKKEALFYSMVKDSYLTNREFDILRSIIYERGNN